MYIVYNLILTFLSIIFSPIILFAFIIKPKFMAGFWQKLGFLPEFSTGKPTIWFHAVSVGEVNAIEALVKRIRQDYKNHNIVLTTVTRTGNQVASNKLSDFVDKIVYFPYDFLFSVNLAIKSINPSLVVVAETEIWPNFSNELRKRGIPLLLVNGRISPNSHKGYKKFSFFFERILKNYSLILMQTQQDMQRIVDIGANSENAEVMGNLKFDIANWLSDNEINSLKNDLGINNQRVIIAGSTHSGEDEIILNAFVRLKQEFEDLKLIVAPRHPERNGSVLKLISETNLKFGVRSKKSKLSDSEIMLLDTMGELGKLYSVSCLAFLGGGFSNTGGHNPLESAIYNVPVISGPTVFNFRDIYNYMTLAGAAFLVENEQELYLKLRNFLTVKEDYNQASQACKAIFESNKGALDYAVARISKFL